MKNTYFTTDSIEKKAQELMDDVKKYRNNHPLDMTIQNAALLIIDMQDYFLKPSSHAFVPSAVAIIENIKQLASCFHSNNQPIIFTRHCNTESNAKNMKTWWKELILEQHPLSQITNAFSHIPGRIITKPQYDAFYDTNLEEMLHKQHKTHLVVTGIVSHLCVETTIRSAFIRGFSITVPVDGIASYSEAFHKATLLTISHGCATPVLTNELIQHIKDETP